MGYCCDRPSHALFGVMWTLELWIIKAFEWFKWGLMGCSSWRTVGLRVIWIVGSWLKRLQRRKILVCGVDILWYFGKECGCFFALVQKIFQRLTWSDLDWWHWQRRFQDSIILTCCVVMQIQWKGTSQAKRNAICTLSRKSAPGNVIMEPSAVLKG